MQRMEYFIRRLLLIVPTFLGITLLCFAITQFVPGGPVDQMLMQMQGISAGNTGGSSSADSAVSEKYKKELEKHFGFDQPFHKRYYKWLVTDRMGMRMNSYKFPNKTAWQLISERFPVSLTFGLSGFFLCYIICIPLGIAKGLRHGSAFDLISSIMVFIGYAIPPLAAGMVLKMMFCGTLENMWDIFPLGGYRSEDFETFTFLHKAKDIFTHMFLPVTCYVLGSFAFLTLLMKNSILEQIGQDYIRTVLAKGGTSRRAIWGHAFRNSLIPIATGFGRILTIMFAGSVIIEMIFDIPGMGRLSIEAIVGRDYAVFMATLAITSLLGLVGNIVSDFCYVLIDPRITFTK